MALPNQTSRRRKTTDQLLASELLLHWIAGPAARVPLASAVPCSVGVMRSVGSLPTGIRPTILLIQTHLGTTLRLALRKSVLRESLLRESVLRGPDWASRHWAEHWSL